MVSPCSRVCTYYAHARVHELKGNRFTAIAGYRKALSLDAGNDDYNKHTQTEARARLRDLGALIESGAEPK